MTTLKNISRKKTKSRQSKTTATTTATTTITTTATTNRKKVKLPEFHHRTTHLYNNKAFILLL